MSVTFREKGSEGLVQYLRTAPTKVRAQVTDQMNRDAAVLSGMIKDNLSGVLLQVKTGRLRASIYARVYVSDKKVTLSFGTRGDVPYAYIQEYGGVVPAMRIVPTKGEALRFLLGGKEVFARSVQRPAINIPAAAYIRTAAQEFMPQFEENVREATTRALRMEFYSG